MTDGNFTPPEHTPPRKTGPFSRRKPPLLPRRKRPRRHHEPTLHLPLVYLGYNALHYAADQAQLECAKVLLRCGCRSNEDHQGNLPADLATEKGHDAVAAFIEAAQAGEAEEEQGTASLAVASRRVPRPMVWADTICINQEDVAEKSAQVAMMDRIYSNRMPFLNTLSTHLAALKDAVIEPLSGKDKGKYAAANMTYISERDWASLASLYQRQWFRRAWTAQEAVLPGALLMCIGDQSLSWRDLGQASEAIPYNEGRLGSSLSSRFIPSASRGGRGGGGGGDDDAKDSRSRFTLKHLVYNFWTFVASDPRDKVFAYDGLLNLYAAERHRADYGMGLAGIYTAATRDLIRGEASLAALSSCVYPLCQRKDLSSWVPDYSVAAANPVPRSFCADRGLEYVPPETTPDNAASSLLRVRGCFIGRV
ncbi:ankyrin repeat protein [Metarhizium robertsii]|uniref:Ankyrin repeat protein n=1 Tax=Metarhizium robertsii TaxID=568076 RepID=A0A014QUG5_9HYPO|nr:ankyrin repeat protein [Metarhizium robertsii]